MQSIAIAFGLFALVVVLFYNFLIGRRNQVDNIFAGLEVQLKKRYDLIPNLVALTQQALLHERTLLEQLTRLRAEGMRAHTPEELLPIHSQLTQALHALHVKVEDYPELNANANVAQLHHTLVDVEDHISAARRAYNQSVTDYNNAIEMIPAKFLAQALGYKRKQVFEVSKSVRQTPLVKIG